MQYKTRLVVFYVLTICFHAPLRTIALGAKFQEPWNSHWRHLSGALQHQHHVYDWEWVVHTIQNHNVRQVRNTATLHYFLHFLIVQEKWRLLSLLQTLVEVYI